MPAVSAGLQDHLPSASEAASASAAVQQQHQIKDGVRSYCDSISNLTRQSLSSGDWISELTLSSRAPVERVLSSSCCVACTQHLIERIRVSLTGNEVAACDCGEEEGVVQVNYEAPRRVCFLQRSEDFSEAQVQCVLVIAGCARAVDTCSRSS